MIAIVGFAFAMHEPTRPAVARDTTSSPASACGSYKNSGPNMVFKDGSDLFSNMDAIRCTLKADFEVRTLAKGESQACVNASGRISSIVQGDNLSMGGCNLRQLVVTVATNQKLYELSAEVRWFALAAAAATMIFDGPNDLETATCIGGYIVAAQAKLDRTKLVEELRALAPEDATGLEVLLAGMSLRVNDRTFLWCVSDYQQWHNPKAEIVTPVSK